MAGVVKLRLVALCATLALAAGAQGQQTVPSAGPAAAAVPAALPGATLASLLDYAWSHNPEFAAMRHEANAVSERVTMAGALMDPRLRIERMDVVERAEMADGGVPMHPPGMGGEPLMLARMTRYQVMQEFPWFGKRELRREIARRETDAAGARASAMWNDITAKIKTTYAQLEFVHRNEQLVREVLDLMVRLERVALARYTGGLAMQADVIRAQVEQTGMKGELLMLEQERRMLEARMNMLLGRDGRAPLARPGGTRTLPAAAQLDAGALAERALASNPTVYGAEAQVRAAQTGRDLALRNRYPDFALAITPTSGSVRKWEWMIEVNIPLQQGSRRAQERESEAMLAAARARREASANQVLAELTENLAGFDVALRNETLAAKSLLPQAELTFQSALASYENGGVDFMTLLEAQRQVRQARQNQLRARADAQARLADIERLIGEDLQ